MNTMIRSKPIRSILAGIVGALTLSFATIAAAADEFNVPKANIRYGDLNLDTPQGAKTLYERIVQASYAVCQSFDRDSRDNADPAALQVCRRQIITDAVARIGKPALYAVYNAKNAKPLQAPIFTAETRQ